MGKPVLVVNRPGAGGSIAAESVARAQADGYTLLLSTTADVINPSLIADLKVDVARDLAPLALLAENPVVLVAPAGSPLNSVDDVVRTARARPGKLTFASGGTGTFTHLYGELFCQVAGVKLTHVPYKGAVQAMTDLMAARVDLSFAPVAPVLAQVKAGTLKVIAVVGDKPADALPGIPTFQAAGLGGFDAALWFGLSGPARLPKAVSERIVAETMRALTSPTLRSQLAEQGVQVVAADPTNFAARIDADLARWNRVAKSAGLKPE
jgi:tripartite-type tricarboxylate transporter receptor subunit TctC